MGAVTFRRRDNTGCNPEQATINRCPCGRPRSSASPRETHLVQVDRPKNEARVLAAVAHWRDLLRESMTDARQLLREVLAAPLRFERDCAVYKFSAPVKTGGLIAGAVGGDLRGGTSPTGNNPASVVRA